MLNISQSSSGVSTPSPTAGLLSQPRRSKYRGRVGLTNVCAPLLLCWFASHSEHVEFCNSHSCKTRMPSMPLSISFGILFPTDSEVDSCLPWFQPHRSGVKQNERGSPQAALQKPCTNLVFYFPAAAPAAAGTLPAIFIASIRASTCSVSAPVSVHAST